MIPPYRTVRLLLSIALLVCATFVRAQTPKECTVMLHASINEGATPSITLKWNKDPNQQVIYIWKKTKETSKFTAEIQDSVVGAGTEWTDKDILVGNSYEYRVFRFLKKPNGTDSATGQPKFAYFYGTGYINAGIKAAPSLRERALVLVDTTFKSALASELSTFQTDLENEGWEVTLRYVPRAETFDSNAVLKTRAVVKEEWNAGPKDLSAIVLVGRVGVPYSGTINPDGHPDHYGAWPADGIYGDHNGNYTDRISNAANTSRPSNNNVPGDGKYDQSQFSTEIDIPVGRIDFYNLPAFTTSELDLLRSYFKKNHEYRANKWTVAIGGVIDDNFGSYGEMFAASAWRSFSVFGRDTAVKSGDFFTDLAGPKVMLLGYGCGGGTDVSAGGVGNSTDMTTKPVNAVFTMLFGSYFGDWDTKNNFLRSVLASQPRALTCGWSGRPHWYIHHMALGESIGYSTRLSQNNQTIVGGQLGNYIPNLFVTTQGNSIASAGDRMVHIALLGDPTLRATTQPVPAVSTLTGSLEYPNKVRLNWNNAGTSADGYYVYRRKVGTKKWTQVTSSMVTALSYLDSTATLGTFEYAVRALSLREMASGSFYEIGRGRVSTIIVTDVAEGSSDIAMNVTVGPNPASTFVDVDLQLPSDTQASIDIVNNAGIMVAQQHYDRLSAGIQSVGFDVSNLPIGSYQIVVRTGVGVLTSPLVIIR